MSQKMLLSSREDRMVELWILIRRKIPQILNVLISCLPSLGPVKYVQLGAAEASRAAGLASW